MQIVLVHRAQNPELGQAWANHFSKCPDVTIIEADITSVDCDAIVSPANSFGFMDGGLDYALSERFGWDLQDRVQEIIRTRYHGELLVGQAEVVSTHDPKVPWLICAPTMRVPMHIKTTVNAYLAMRAILRSARSPDLESPIETIAIPGLGTGVGALDVETAALQMRAAFDEVALGTERRFDDFGDAQEFQLSLNRLGMIYD